VTTNRHSDQHRAISGQAFDPSLSVTDVTTITETLRKYYFIVSR